MAKVSKSASRSVYIASPPPVQGSMTVWALRDFLAAVDAEGIPDNATLECQRDHNTFHFTGVSVRYTVPISPDPTTPDSR
jgi:hypothetical protein